jgi:hypothetical protein
MMGQRTLTKAGAVIMSKINGAAVTEEEVRTMLERFGPIELLAPTQRMEHPRNNLQGGMYVKFAFYLDCQDALKVCIP